MCIIFYKVGYGLIFLFIRCIYLTIKADDMIIRYITMHKSTIMCIFCVQLA